MADNVLDRVAVELVAQTTSFKRDMQQASRDFKRNGQAMVATGQQVAQSLTAQQASVDRAHANYLEQQARREKAAAAERQALAKQSGQQRAIADVEAQERVYQESIARIKEAQARGLLTPKEARVAGEQAALEYNAAVLKVIDEGQRSKALVGASGRDAFVQVAGSLKNVEKSGISAGVGLGRLNQTMASVLRQATGTHPAVGQVANVLGSLALGGAVTAGALVGIAAIVGAFRKLTEETRENERATRDAIARLEELQRKRDLGPGGELGEAVRLATAERDRIQDEIDRLQKQLSEAAGRGGLTSEEDVAFGGPSPAFLKARIETLRERYAELKKTIATGEQELGDPDFQGPSYADFLKEQARLEREAQLEREQAAKASQELVASLQIQVEAQARLSEASGADDREAINRQLELEAQLRDNLATATAADAAEVEELTRRLHELTQSNADAAAAEKDRLAEAERARREAEQTAAQVAETVDNLSVQADQQRRLVIAQQEGADAVRALNLELAVENALREAGIDAGHEQAAAIRAAAAEHFLAAEALNELAEAQRRTQQEARDAERAAVQASRETERAIRDLIRLGVQLGEVWGETGEQVANVIGAAASGFLAGGPIGALIGGGGALLGELFGGDSGPSPQQIENERRLREEREKALAATKSAAEVERELEERRREAERVARELADAQRQRQDILGEYAVREAALSSEQQAAGIAREIQLRRELAELTKLAEAGIISGDELARMSDILLLEVKQAAEQAAAALKQQAAQQEAVNRQLDSNSRADRLLQAQTEDQFVKDLNVRERFAVGDDFQGAIQAFQNQLEREYLAAVEAGFSDETLARLREIQGLETAEFFKNLNDEIARSEALLKERVEDFQRDIAIRALEADGQKEHAAQLRLRIAQEKELAEAMELGIDLAAVRAVHEAEMNALIAEQNRLEQERLQAEAQRISSTINGLRLRLLRAQGLEQEARALEKLIEIESFRNEGFGAGIIALLEQVHAAEDAARALEEQKEAQDKLNESISQTTTALNAPAGLRLSLLRWRALLADQIAGPSVNAGFSVDEVAGFSGGRSGAGSTSSTEVFAPSYNFESLVLQSSGPGESGEELLQKIERASEDRARRGGADTFRRRR